VTAFDTDVLSDILKDRPDYLVRLARIARADRTTPVVVAGEIVRGGLAAVRAAEAGKGRLTLPDTYDLLVQSLLGLREYRILSFTPAAEHLVAHWRTVLKLKVGTNDLRIAAVAVSHGAKLATRNVRDFALVPGLALDVWN
jgi:tRNA(fMet)-specific endonuclease VapC